MKSLITICLIIVFSFTLKAQRLNGTQEYTNPSQFSGNRYNIVNWEADYRVFIKGDAFMHRLSNPTIYPSVTSLYGRPGNLHSKADLGLSTWPNSTPTTANMSLELTLMYPDGSLHKTSASVKQESFIESTSKFKNAGPGSFKVVSVEIMRYNGGMDDVVDKLIFEKKNGKTSGNATISNPAAAGNPSANNNYSSNTDMSKDKFTQNVETVGGILNAAAPLLQGWANKHNAKIAARDAERERESDQNTRLRRDYEQMIEEINRTLYTKEGITKYFIDQIPTLLETPSPTWEKLLGSPKYAGIFGKNIDYIAKNFKPRAASKKDLREALETGNMFFPSLPVGISNFYAAYTNSGIDNLLNADYLIDQKSRHNFKFIFDEKDIVIGINIGLNTSVGYGQISIKEYINDIYKKVKNNYILAAGNTILLKDKIIVIDHDDLQMYDLNYINDRILIKWPESYVNSESISKGRYKLYNIGIEIKQEINKNDSLAKQLAYEIKDREFYKIPISDKGIIVYKTRKGSSADRAGLKSGDIITEIRGLNVTSPYLFQLIIEGYSKEGKFNLKYLRDGKEYDTIVTL